MNQHFDPRVVPIESLKSSLRAKTQTISKPKRGQANRRERVRTENVNVGFEKLRKIIPTDPEDRKLSKIEVLRLATSYINHLYNLTRANSCLEAETIDIGSTDTSSDEDSKDELTCLDDDEKGVNSKRDFVGTSLMIDLNTKLTNKTTTKNHICTFCLMMTKTASATTTNKTSVSTKRK